MSRHINSALDPRRHNLSVGVNRGEAALLLDVRSIASVNPHEILRWREHHKEMFCISVGFVCIHKRRESDLNTAQNGVLYAARLQGPCRQNWSRGGSCWSCFSVAAYGGRGGTLSNFIKAGLTCLAVTILVAG